MKWNENYLLLFVSSIRKSLSGIIVVWTGKRVHSKGADNGGLFRLLQIRRQPGREIEVDM